MRLQLDPVLYREHLVEAKNGDEMTKQEIIEMIYRASFEAVERDAVYNRAAAV